ncbi:unnamed protein product [Fraxinus pennsylvanica]|uniref:Uncharacterized protein n=1 Tax=Fraxinus pennsylvanica TaxID=56036 RepID=A0AAD1Z2T4_9LAMI|nr:unnamed protein product [Fraxinus pennsylvanica]
MVAQNTLRTFSLLLHKISECVITHRKDGDGFPSVDTSGGSIFGQKIVKIAEFRESSKEPGDVEDSLVWIRPLSTLPLVSRRSSIAPSQSTLPNAKLPIASTIVSTSITSI